jgi:hypothetical protein
MSAKPLVIFFLISDCTSSHAEEMKKLAFENASRILKIVLQNYLYEANKNFKKPIGKIKR